MLLYNFTAGFNLTPAQPWWLLAIVFVAGLYLVTAVLTASRAQPADLNELDEVDDEDEREN